MRKMGEREKLAQKLGGSESPGKVGVLKTGLGKGKKGSQGRKGVQEMTIEHLTQTK